MEADYIQLDTEYQELSQNFKKLAKLEKSKSADINVRIAHIADLEK